MMMNTITTRSEVLELVKNSLNKTVSNPNEFLLQIFLQDSASIEATSKARSMSLSSAVDYLEVDCPTLTDLFSKLRIALGKVKNRKAQEKLDDILARVDETVLAAVRESNNTVSEEVVPEFYSMLDYKFNGKMICFIFKEFKHIQNRVGASYDLENLRQCASRLGYNFIEYINLRKAEFKSIINQHANGDFSEYASLIVAVSTHGTQYDYLMASDSNSQNFQSMLQLNKDVVKPFYTTPTLQEKPKIFLIQACRGDEKNAARIATDSISTDNVPGSDCIIVFSSIPGYVSWRSSSSGSHFFTAFKDVIMSSPLPLSFDDFRRKGWLIKIGYHLFND